MRQLIHRRVATGRSTRPLIALWITILALLGAMILVACSSSGGPHSRVIRLPLYGAATTLDPALASTPAEMYVDTLVYAGLMKMAPDLHIVPDLAVSIPTISSSGRTYTFTIRQDARFADGRPVTARNVAHSFARALEMVRNANRGRSPGGRYLGNIVGARAVESGRTDVLIGVRVLGRLTVRVRLVRPDATFLQKLALPAASVVETVSAPGLPPGAGPFGPPRKQRDGTMVLTPRPHYYGGLLQLKALDLVPVRTLAAGLDQYRKGAVDVAQASVTDWSKLSSRADFHQSSSLDGYYAVPQGTDGVALAASLDRNRLIQDSTPALSSLASIVPPAVPDYVASPPVISAGSSPGGVMRGVNLVIGVGDGIDTPCCPSLPLASPPSSSAAVTLQLLRRALLQQWKAGGTGAARVTLVHASYLLPDPSIWLRLVLPKTRSRWFRRLLTRAMGLTNDPVTRMSAYSREENWAIAQGLIIPLASGSYGYLIKPQVQGLQVAPLGVVPDNNSWAAVSVS